MRQQSRHLPAFVLLLLGERPLHGGAIQTELKESLPSLKADSGAIYRALQQLEEESEVVSEWDTSQAGPARKIYSITPAGRRKLDVWRQDIESRMQVLKYFLVKHKRLKK
jgi:PadR family transcriptional regulator, regulatory protein PadR